MTESNFPKAKFKIKSPKINRNFNFDCNALKLSLNIKEINGEELLLTAYSLKY